MSYSRRAPATVERTAGGTTAFAAMAMFVSYLPFSSVNGVLGTIGAELGADTAALQLVTEAFTAALTGAVLSGGALAARFGRRRVALAGLAFSASGALVSWVAGGGAVWFLWIGQGIAGVGAGLVMSATLSLITATAPSPAARNRAIAVWAAATGAGLGVGPFLSAAMSAVDTWRSLFPPLATLAALTAVFGLARAHEAATPPPARLDLTGQLLGTLGLVALVCGVISGGGTGWTAPGTVAGLGVGAGLLTVFLIVEHRTANPVLRPVLFASRGFTAAGLSAAVALFTVVGVVFAATLFLAGQDVSDLGGAARIGWLFAGNTLASVAAGALRNRYGARAVLLGGLVVAVLGLVALLSVDESTHLVGLACRFALLGAGCGTVVATSTAVAVQSVPGPLAGMAGTANNVLRQLGGALGPAVVGSVLVRQLARGASPAAAVHACFAVLLAAVAATAAVTAGLLLVRTN